MQMENMKRDISSGAGAEAAKLIHLVNAYCSEEFI
jgi:hypothetical protein